MRLMTSVPVGRIAYTRQALPAVEVVNFTLDRGDIVFRADAGDKLAAAISDAVVAFEADSMDFAQHTGWSHFIKITPVIVNGRRLVTGQQEEQGNAHHL